MGFPGSGDCFNFAIPIYDTEGMPATFKDVKIPFGIHGTSTRIKQRSFRRENTIFWNGFFSRSRNCIDFSATQIDRSDAAVFNI